MKLFDLTAQKKGTQTIPPGYYVLVGCSTLSAAHNVLPLMPLLQETCLPSTPALSTVHQEPRIIMAGVDVQAPSADTPVLPDYLLDPNAVLGDKIASWRYGKAPDY